MADLNLNLSETTVFDETMAFDGLEWNVFTVNTPSELLTELARYSQSQVIKITNTVKGGSLVYTVTLFI